MEPYSVSFTTSRCLNDILAIITGSLLVALIGCTSSPKSVENTNIKWKEPITVAEGRTVVGPWRMNRSRWKYVDDPSVDLTPNLASGVAWVDQQKKDIFFQVFQGDGSRKFASPRNVSRTPSVFSWFPDLVINADKDPFHVYLIWQEIVFSGGTHGGEIYFTRSVNGGDTFGDILNLSRSEAGDGKGRLTPRLWDNGSLDLKRGPKGRLYAAWTEYEGRLWFTYSKDNGESFADPVMVAGGKNSLPARGPSIGASKKWVYLVWTVGDTKMADVRFQRLNRKGQAVGTPKIIRPNDGHSDSPKVAVSDSGSVHLVWSESPDGPGGDYELRYFRRPAGASEFQEARKLTARSSSIFESYHYPSLRLDARGNPYILWDLYPKEEIKKSYALGLIWSSNQGRTFEAPVVVEGSLRPDLGFNGSLQGQLFEKLDVENDGNIAVVNSTFSPNDSSHVWLYRGRVMKNN